MSVRSFKALTIPGRSDHDVPVDDYSRSPSFISLGSRVTNNFSNDYDMMDNSYSRSNSGFRRSYVREIPDLSAKRHISPGRVGRNLVASKRDEPRRQSCPPTPERLRSFDSPQKRLIRRTFHVEDQLNKSAHSGISSPCMFRVNCNDSAMPGKPNSRYSSSAVDNAKHNSKFEDNLSSKSGDERDNKIPSDSQESRNIVKDFFLSLFYTVITIIKWFFITVACIVLAVVLQHAYGIYHNNQCNYYTRMNMTSLKDVLSTEVYGQSLVTEAVINNIGEYLSEPDQNTPLVLSFYGWTGVGKNFVSGIIADHVRSPTVIKIIVPLHFPHVQDKDLYAEQFVHWITSNITDCAVNLFIIDEIDKASWPIEETFRDMIVSLKESKLAQRSAKVIILLLSNKAASLVNRYLYDVLLSGGTRADVKLDRTTEFVLERTDILALDVWLKEQSPLNQMLPFLPLQQPQVEECIVRDMRMKGRNASTETVKQILNSLPFAPKNSPLFSVTGCRKVSPAVDLHSNDGT